MTGKWQIQNKTVGDWLFPFQAGHQTPEGRKDVTERKKDRRKNWNKRKDYNRGRGRRHGFSFVAVIERKTYALERGHCGSFRLIWEVGWANPFIAELAPNVGPLSDQSINEGATRKGGKRTQRERKFVNFCSIELPGNLPSTIMQLHYVNSTYLRKSEFTLVHTHGEPVFKVRTRLRLIKKIYNFYNFSFWTETLARAKHETDIKHRLVYDVLTIVIS